MVAQIQHRVFLDTNILLSFFEVSKVDIDELGKAVELANQHEVVFVSTDVVKAEFFRRREGVISKSIEEFSAGRLPHIPVMARTLASTADYLNATGQYEKARSALEKELRDRAVKRTLEADLLIQSYFGLARMIKVTASIREAARYRVECGNPPGKKGQLGDALNWEALLSLGPDRSLTLVSDDVDYRDRLCKGEMNTFLHQEWKSNHHGNLNYFQSLSDFVKAELNLPKFGDLAAVDTKIDTLASSKSFAQTHAAISELSAVTYFSPKQVVYLIDILHGNNQVLWIASDPDVKEFYSKVVKDYAEHLNDSAIELVKSATDPLKNTSGSVFD